jgi:hypothetical protein
MKTLSRGSLFVRDRTGSKKRKETSLFNIVLSLIHQLTFFGKNINKLQIFF